MSGPVDDGVPHDDWLRAALRHAPDANAAPPPEVSETILRAARAQASAGAPARAPAARASTLQALRDAWAWLARPPVAAGFATLMVATVVTLMWWDRPLEEALPPRERPTVAQAPAPAAAPAAREAEPAPPPTSVAQAAVAPAPAPAPPVAAKSVPRPAPTTAARRPDAPRRADEQRDEALRDREATVTAKAQDVERRARVETDQATAPAGAAPRAEAAAPGIAPAVAPAAAPAARPTASLAQGFARRDAPAPLGSLRTTIATEPERWSWQRDGGAAMPMNTPVMQWLQRVGETTRGRWAVPDTAAEIGAPPAATMVLLRDGRVHTTLRLSAGAVEVEGTSPRARAALPGAESTALRVELDQATR